MSNKQVIIIGEKGGKNGGNSSPTTAEDSLNSTAKVNILDAISEGEIEGFDTAREEGHAQGNAFYLNAMQKDIFLDDTPILRKQANSLSPITTDFNFQGITLAERRGTVGQTVIPGFNSTLTETSVNHIFDIKDEVATRTSNSQNVDQLRITINIPQLQKFEDDGDIVGSEVKFLVFVAFDGASFPAETEANATLNLTITGRTGNLYQKDFLININHINYSSSFSIKIKRLTDTAATKTVNSFTWFSFTEIIWDNNTYDNTALLGISADADSFSSIPRRSFFLRGIKTKIPSSGVVTSVSQTGKNAGRINYNTNLWDGTFQAATWNTCPAWALYDLLTDTRYGLSIPESALDKYSFFAISKYNNELVSDRRVSSGTMTGTWTQNANEKFITVTTTSVHNLQTDDFIDITFTTGQVNSAPSNQAYIVQFLTTTIFRLLNINTAPTTNISGNCSFLRQGNEVRFSLNAYINKSYEAYDLINLICSNMRVMPFWSAGTLFLSQDKATSASYLFTNANVIEGNFTYEGSDLKTRSTLVIVKYFDNIQRKISYVQDPIKANIASDAACTKYGIIEKSIEGFGITSAGQASRLARWVRFSEQNLTETITFVVSLDSGVIVRPGQVIAVNDTVKTGIRRGGRIKSVPTNTTNQIVVDDASASDLPANGVSYTRTLNVLMPDGSVSSNAISDITGSTITVSGQFTMAGVNTAPNPNSVWIIETSGGTSAQNIQNSLYRVISVTEENGINYKVTGLTYNESAYAHVEAGADVQYRDATNLNELPTAPTTVTITERLYKEVTNQNGIINANEKITNKGKIKVKLIVNWTQVKGVVNYKVLFRKDNGNFQSVIVQGVDFEIPDVQAGKVYEFKVFSLNGANNESPTSADATRTTVGKTDPPSNVSNLTATVDPIAGVILSWTENAPNPAGVTGTDVEFKDLDIAYYEIHKVTGGVGTGITDSNFGDKDAATFLTRDQAPDTVTGNYPAATTSYFIKARDDGGRFSTTADSVVATINLPSVIQNVTVTQENGILQIRWTKPSTHSFNIKQYKISYTTSSTTTVFVDTTEFTIPISFTGSSRTFTILAVDIGGNEGTAHNETVAIPMPPLPSNFSHEFTTDSVKLKWEQTTPTSPLTPPVIGYRIYRGNNVTDEIAQISATEFLVLVNNNSFPNRVSSYHVAAVFLDPVNSTKGSASTNTATITNLEIIRAPAPTITQSFELDFLILSWSAVNGSLPTLNYGIYDLPPTNVDTLIEQTDTTTFKTKANFPINSSNGKPEKLFKIAGLSAAYHNATDASVKQIFKGKIGNEDASGNPVGITASVSLPSVPDYIGADQSKSINLGSEGGLGFVTISFVAGTVDPATQLGLKDFRIIRSTSNTFNSNWNTGSTTGIDLELFTDALTFKEEVSWSIPDNSTDTSISRYYYVQARDLLNNIGSALKIEVEISRPSTVPSEGISEVIDNNVLLRWGQPSVNPNSQLKIDHYEIRKHTGNNTNWSTSTALGGSGESITDSRFSVIFETVGAQYTYLIKAYDVAGNSSLLPFTRLLEVAEPPDFILNANYDSAFRTALGTYTQSGTTVTVTLSLHRFKVGDLVTLFPTSGGAVGDLFNQRPVTSVADANTFTVTSFTTKTVSSSNITVKTITGLTEPAEVDSVAFTNCLKVFDSDLNKNVIYLPVVTDSNGNGTQTWEEHFIGTGSSSSPQFANITAIINSGLTEYLEPAPLYTGSYSQSGTTVTITRNNHGFVVGNELIIDYTTGSAVDGTFLVASVTNANVFTVTAADSISTNGNVVITGSNYQEVFDYGTNLSSTKITTLATNLAEGTLAASGQNPVNLQSKLQIASGDSGGSFDGGVTTNLNSVSRFGVGLQRVKYTTSVVSTAGSLLKITNLQFKLDTKIKNDTGKGSVASPLTGSGTYSQSSSTTITINISNHGLLTGCFVILDFTSGGQSNAGDGDYQITKVDDNSFTVIGSNGTNSGNVSFSTSGTPVYFNTSFVDIQGVNVTPNTTSAVIAVVDFKDVPNPKSFQVLFFNPQNGNAVTTGDFTWQCRGT